MKQRVVVTGVGVISPVGIGNFEFWNSIKSGKIGIQPVSKFDTDGFPSKLAAEVNDFQVHDFIEKKEARRMDRYTQFAVAASKMAVEDASLPLERINNERMGVIIGSGIGGLETLENQYRTFLEKGPGKVSPFFIPMMISNMASGQVAIYLDARA